MAFFSLVLLASIASKLQAQTPLKNAVFIAPSAPRLIELSDEKLETEHFIITWRTAEASPKEVAQAEKLAELFFAQISEYVGTSHTPSQKLVLMLDGEAKQGPASALSRNGYRIPHVDRQGRIHLYRYNGNYFEALSHEMVHAFRRQTNDWKDGFFEEGFASLIGNMLQPHKKGFPAYGFPLTVVAGHWLAGGEDIPLMTLKQQHRQLSLKCMAQSYSLRASFFEYLQVHYGDAPLRDLAYGTASATPARYEAIFGLSFDMLHAAWRADLLKRFHAMDRSARLAQDYRTTTPVKHWPICRAGEDF